MYAYLGFKGSFNVMSQISEFNPMCYKLVTDEAVKEGWFLLIFLFEARGKELFLFSTNYGKKVANLADVFLVVVKTI